jgi:endonuclease III
MLTFLILQALSERTTQKKMEEATMKVLAQVVPEGADIWKEDNDEATSTQANDSGVAKL